MDRQYVHVDIHHTHDGQTSDSLAAMLDLIALILAFMAPDQQLKTIGLQKLLSHILPKCYPHPPLAGHQPFVGTRVTPEHFSHGTFVGGLLVTT